MTTSYPSTIIKQDRPSILIDFHRIPFNITPCQLKYGKIYIPNNYLTNWREVEFKKLENNITSLRAINSNYINLIKILKLWNKNRNKQMKKF